MNELHECKHSEIAMSGWLSKSIKKVFCLFFFFALKLKLSYQLIGAKKSEVPDEILVIVSVELNFFGIAPKNHHDALPPTPSSQNKKNFLISCNWKKVIEKTNAEHFIESLLISFFLKYTCMYAFHWAISARSVLLVVQSIVHKINI